MLMNANGIQLIPYDEKCWNHLEKWFYNDNYKEMWRHNPRIWTEKEFRQYPQVVGADVFLIFIKGKKEPIGYVQLAPDVGRSSRAFYLGILLEKEHQNQGISATVFGLVFKYAFNRLGYRKCIVEIVASNHELKKNLTKAGFLFEGSMFGNAYMNGEYVDELRYSLSASFFNKKYKELVESWESLDNC